MLHPANPVRTQIAFSEHQASVSMETYTLEGGDGGLRRASRCWRLGRKLVALPRFVYCAPLIHNIN